MKTVFQLLFVFLFFACCKDKSPSPQEPVNPIDTALAASWKLVNLTSNTGVVTSNSTNLEILTSFRQDTNMLRFNYGGTSGSGTYTRKIDKGINISVWRSDAGGWANGPWVDLYLENMNKANSYSILGDQLKIKTSENNLLIFSKQ